jgi:hypothetical protein
MDRHKLTDGHRRRTGQDDDGGGGAGERAENGEGGSKRARYPCLVPECGSTFNRGDNLRQHVVKKHGLEGLRGMEGEGGMERGARGRRGGGRVGRLDVGMGMGMGTELRVRVDGGVTRLGWGS